MDNNDKAGCLALGAVGIAGIAIAIGVYLLVAWLLQWAWNASLPALCHAPTLRYWQACALLGLLHIVGSAFFGKK